MQMAAPFVADAAAAERAAQERGSQLSDNDPAISNGCVEFTGEEHRLGGVVRYSAHICIALEPDRIQGIVRNVEIVFDESCSTPGVRAALQDPDVAADLREDLGLVAVERYLVRDSGRVTWRGVAASRRLS